MLNEDIDKISKDLVDEEVFKKSFIPRTLDDVFDVERDTLKVLKGEGDDVSKVKIELFLKLFCYLIFFICLVNLSKTYWTFY
jgi:hypothetical protein